MLRFKKPVKEAVVFAACILFLLSATGQYTVNINGVIKGAGNKKIYLGNKKSGVGPGFIELFYDSVFAKNDSFRFRTHSFRYFDNYSIEIEGEKGWKTFLIDTGTITVYGVCDSIWKAKIIGSPNHDFLVNFNRQVYLAWESKTKRLRDSVSGLAKIQTSRKKAMIDSLMLLLNTQYTDTIKKITTAICRQNSFLAYRIFSYLPLNAMPLDSIRFYFSQFSEEVRNYPELQDIKYRIGDFEKNISPGSYLPPVLLFDTARMEVNAIPDQGKIRLLNFWASWCGPCLNEIPQLDSIRHVYEKYNFSIISISIDDSMEKWKSKLNQFTFPTYHLITDAANNSGIIKYFRIFSIPFAILIDGEGRIVKYDIALKDIGEEIMRLQKKQ